ncbi:hypothetical protein JB92DRAFT_491673 [Gautieria morchelliformis]|nr:hypothetical protein JB92DRAFT_121286 [Gautieria morchelliformis]KAF8509676.1 hypothetical protein JB92DRAFT_491673 [Gautieria morchelliformis]
MVRRCTKLAVASPDYSTTIFYTGTGLTIQVRTVLQLRPATRTPSREECKCVSIAQRPEERRRGAIKPDPGASPIANRSLRLCRNLHFHRQPHNLSLSHLSIRVQLIHPSLNAPPDLPAFPCVSCMKRALCSTPIHREGPSTSRMKSISALPRTPPSARNADVIASHQTVSPLVQTWTGLSRQSSPFTRRADVRLPRGLSVRCHSYNNLHQDRVSPYALNPPRQPLLPFFSYTPYVLHHTIDRQPTVACEVGMVGGGL